MDLGATGSLKFWASAIDSKSTFGKGLLHKLNKCHPSVTYDLIIQSVIKYFNLPLKYVLLDRQSSR